MNKVTELQEDRLIEVGLKLKHIFLLLIEVAMAQSLFFIEEERHIYFSSY